jgi:hypothetical protein
MDKHFTVFVNDWLWEFFVSRYGSNCVQDSSMHASFPFDAFIPQILQVGIAAQSLTYNGQAGSNSSKQAITIRKGL